MAKKLTTQNLKRDLAPETSSQCILLAEYKLLSESMSKRRQRHYQNEFLHNMPHL